MRVLVVEPGKKPFEKDIDPGLRSLQDAVGGYIECLHPFLEPVGLVCNEEAKLEGLPLNRALRDEDGYIYDTIAGTFLIVGLGDGEFCSLCDEHVERFSERFGKPERILLRDNKILVIPVDE